MSWIIGIAHAITWETDDFYYIDDNDVPQPDTVKLEISHDGGENWDTISADTPNDGNYSWVVTGPAAANAMIRYSGVHLTDVTFTTVEFAIVEQVFTSAVVYPLAATVVPNGTQQFVATDLDQDGNVMLTPATFTWTVSDGGTIDPDTGLFTAGETLGGPYTVTATSGAISAQAAVSVANRAGDAGMTLGMGMAI